MRSIGARLAISYALSATASLSILCALGYQLQQSQLFKGLDAISLANFRQLKARLDDNSGPMDSASLRQRLRETTEYSAALFYIVVENPKTGSRFRSENLHGAEIPDIKGRRTYNATVPGVGEARVNEYLLPPLDVTIATPTRPVRESMRAYVRACAALTILMLLMSMAIGFGLSRVLLRPVRLIRETANRIRSDNLSERVPVGKVDDEISDLARLLNQMFDRIEAAFEQIRRFSQEASHELKTPLSLIRLHAERMLAGSEPSSTQEESLLVQIEEVGRLNRIIDDLLFISQAEASAVTLQLQPTAVNEFLDGFYPDAHALAEHKGLVFSHSTGPDAIVDMDQKWIRQVLLNILSNAIRHSPPDGKICLISRVSASAWTVCLTDQGPGVRGEDLERIFHRFVRVGSAAPTERGSGLGLAICRSIVDLHLGNLYAERASQGGLSVSFEIPVARAAMRPDEKVRALVS